ncbi:RecQ family ATP-dependent DNA helicase [Hanstruepera neustonica]|uniref:ATP-dependent DNA helicase RecQ n=1 Tax=Hanstruepera neustonica TaxID=1445657 RepID=A0A2K1DXS5_9FLAO|nr:RecQ family ATP-dependent DNA helicase [Hanstruepera neustonica]PNQ72839.1 RecQ family ATP-dependent DNA helicase [Hanstruepera neustonica]
MEQPIDILETYWGFTTFRPLQEDIIQAVLENEDTFALLPTGGGKSMCFQIPALIKDGICLVVSPLVALMKNQVQTLNDKGIKAMALTSGISYDELDTKLDNCIYGNYKFLYLSPERLQQEIVQDRIRQMPVNLIAVDEAHCISQWGHDFRPAYRNIAQLREWHPQVNCIALTASATPEVVNDIVTELDFINPKIFKQSFHRSNLAYMTFDTNDKRYEILRILKKNPEPAIIYVRNRKLTIELSSYLSNNGIAATYFHGGLSNTEKTEQLNDWLSEKQLVMVATNAFGMGIDKPNVKTVIHFSLPDSLESYFQEAGRAGRNGNKAFAVILKGKQDDLHLKNQFLSALPSVDFIKTVYRKLCNYFQIPYGEGQQATYNFNFNLFCKTYGFESSVTYNAIQALDRSSIISLTQQFKNHTQLQFIVANDPLFDYLDTYPELAMVTKSILRTYGGVFEHETPINTLRISEKAGITEPQLEQHLRKLEKDEIIALKLSKTDAQITFIEPREDDKTINRIAQTIDQQNTLKKKQIQSVLDYVDNQISCKSVQLLTYFGETHVQDCGICSVCIQKKKTTHIPDAKSVRHAIIAQLENQPLSSRELTERLPYNKEEIQETLNILLEHHIIDITKTNTYKLAHL